MVKPKDSSDILKFPVRKSFWMAENEELYNIQLLIIGFRCIRLYAVSILVMVVQTEASVFLVFVVVIVFVFVSNANIVMRVQIGMSLFPCLCLCSCLCLCLWYWILTWSWWCRLGRRFSLEWRRHQSPLAYRSSSLPGTFWGMVHLLDAIALTKSYEETKL